MPNAGGRYFTGIVSDPGKVLEVKAAFGRAIERLRDAGNRPQ